MTTTTGDHDTVRTDGRLHADGDLTYAYLPAPTVQSHAANLMTLPDGRLGCVWFGGTQEGVPDISVWFSTLAPGAEAWSAPRQLSDDPTRSEQNPILFPAPGGDLWLLWTAQHAGNQDTAEVRRRISRDSGETWGPVETLFPPSEAGGVFVRQPPVVLSSGRWIIPVFRCLSVPGQKWVGDHDDSAVMISDDAGATWREVLLPGSTGCVHMNVQELGDGTLLALFRSRWADAIHESRSRDGGETWDEPTPTELPNNNSSIQYVRLADGRLALVYNHRRADASTERRLSLYDEIDDDGLAPEQAAAVEPEPREGERTAFWGTPRAPMTLALSDDDGRSWTVLRDLDTGDGYCLSNNSREGLNREFSYPSIHQGPDGTLHIAYTYFRQAIKYVRLDLPRV
ncbi:exo-alpha-sialidase [Kocuria sp. M1R5S2]|uniref:sialidase family protein n=1 Tax=Kocuria rhizosphaerae TaxID=3376285 RepID=UPI0037A0B2E4